MKKKLFLCVILLTLSVGAVFFGIRSIVGWRPFKSLTDSDINYYSPLCVKLGENPDWYPVLSGTVGRLVRVLNEVEVVPYYGEYDPYDASMMYIIFQYSDKLWAFHRIGVTTDPKPIMTIDGKAYLISEESAEQFRDYWEDRFK